MLLITSCCTAAHAQHPDCSKQVDQRLFDSRTDGPFVQLTGFSKKLMGCVVVTRQGLPTVHDDISMTTWIYDATTRKQLWKHRTVVNQGQADRRDNALEEALTDLEVVSRHPRQQTHRWNCSHGNATADYRCSQPCISTT
jgi:hypothetical protein